MAEHRTLDVGALLRVCAEQCVLQKRSAWLYRFERTDPLSCAVDYIKQHPTTRGSYAASLRAGANCLHVFSCNPSRTPEAPLGCDGDLETRIEHADSCQGAAFALYERLRATEERGEQAVLQSKTRGLLRLARPACNVMQVLNGFPVHGTFTNPLLVLEGPGTEGNMLSLLTPDDLSTGLRAGHTWVCAGFYNSRGEMVRVNLDPTLKQFGATLPRVWFGEDCPDAAQPLRFQIAGFVNLTLPRAAEPWEAALVAALDAV